MTSTGSVQWFDGLRGYGYIDLDDDHESACLFVHFSEIKSKGLQTLHKGQSVEFKAVYNDDGRGKAINVTGPNGDYVDCSEQKSYDKKEMISKQLEPLISMQFCDKQKIEIININAFDQEIMKKMYWSPQEPLNIDPLFRYLDIYYHHWDLSYFGYDSTAFKETNFYKTINFNVYKDEYNMIISQWMRFENSTQKMGMDIIGLITNFAMTKDMKHTDDENLKLEVIRFKVFNKLLLNQFPECMMKNIELNQLLYLNGIKNYMDNNYKEYNINNIEQIMFEWIDIYRLKMLSLYKNGYYKYKEFYYSSFSGVQIDEPETLHSGIWQFQFDQQQHQDAKVQTFIGYGLNLIGYGYEEGMRMDFRNNNNLNMDDVNKLFCINKLISFYDINEKLKNIAVFFDECSSNKRNTN